jgi:lipopolysaccharide transport system ATP-binding protein
MTDTVVRVEGLGKKYQIGVRDQYSTLRETLTRKATAPLRALQSLFSASAEDASSGSSVLWALQDVGFELRRGDVLGIIGANGAGKSTLLKVLSRITAPTTGQIEIDGRVGSLLEVGTGFHHELTGRENIYLSGALLGMRRVEIESRFDAIVGFAGIEQFIDTPVKRYSSGMYTRLAFAVAAHLDTEITLVDEVLAVGDAAFQLQCLNKMSEVSESGRTILFVSHNMEAVTKLCNRGLLLDRGRVTHIGTPQDCIDKYLAIAKERKSMTGATVSLRNHAGRTKLHNGPVRMSSLSVLDSQGRPAQATNGGEELTIIIGYELLERQPHTVTFAVTFSNFYNHRLASCRSHDTHLAPIRVAGPGEIACTIPRLPLIPGFYRISVSCYTEAGHSDGVYDAVILEVVGSSFYPSGLVPPRTHGELIFDHNWKVLSDDQEPAVSESAVDQR